MRPAILFFIIAFLLHVPAACAFDLDVGKDLTRQEKAIALNAGAALFMTAWGVIFWDYFQTKPKFGSEDWFGQNTSNGGADKLGHFYSAYVLSHSFSYVYEKLGYPYDEAALYGSLSSFGLLGLVELGDAFSSTYGLSYEDFIMNTLGNCVGFLTKRYPEVSRKIDLRLEYRPNTQESDIFTDYDHMKFLLAVKLDGFDFIKNNYLKYLELHFGYYVDGYSKAPKYRSRNIYVALGLNLSKIASQFSFKKLSTFFRYYQTPYTYVSTSKRLKR
ncbi:MAG: DUF2279 domain-containing protein [Deltaproteobacteria bacterium]|nr:DUF2279 domain-containing protein [Deltaproteobacteria bacterium]MBW2070460.1 DUF2279 domain-containing protein [Deltaproteobacteria bacterium]